VLRLRLPRRRRRKRRRKRATTTWDSPCSTRVVSFGSHKWWFGPIAIVNFAVLWTWRTLGNCYKRPVPVYVRIWYVVWNQIFSLSLCVVIVLASICVLALSLLQSKCIFVCFWCTLCMKQWPQAVWIEEDFVALKPHIAPNATDCKRLVWAVKLKLKPVQPLNIYYSVQLTCYLGCAFTDKTSVAPH
jgi:hypothetical protein